MAENYSGRVRATYTRGNGDEFLWSWARLKKVVEEGAEASVRYDSRFGGVQEVSGKVEIEENYNGTPVALVVGDRRLDRERVESTSSGRVVGEVEGFEVVLSFEDALHIIDRNSGGYDVDAPSGDEDGPVIVQYWEGSPDSPDFWGAESRFETVEEVEG